MTDTLVWDEAGTRYYETGVSKAIFFDMNMVGVVWNGLIAVNLDPQGGEPEPLYFDGVKYSNKMLAEDFQASIQAINTPREFEAAEGIRPLKDSFGGKTHFNQRAKFNMCWRTEIGNDESESVAYKIHIAYNCTVQPSSRAYQTISDNTSPDIRTFVITATPACGRNSYFTFDSRDGDLTELEAQLYSGNLPRCWELSGLTASLDPDAPVSNDDCPILLTDFENYNPGQELDEDVVKDNTETYIYGVVNNGLDITELPATGAFAANDSAASEVGTHPVLVDDDDATYISSADGDLGYTIGLPSLVGYVEGSSIELHIRMSISGGVNPDDPDNLDADAQVHISTDAGGDDTIGGFSDGADEGMGFALTSVDGTPVDYVIPLSMDAWVDTDIQDVIDALTAGAYLNFVGASNNNTDTTPEVRVYEAYVSVDDATNQDLCLRVRTPDDSTNVEQHIYSSGTDDLVSACEYNVDFVMFERTPDDSYSGFEQDPMTNSSLVLLAHYDDGGDGDTPSIEWFDGTVSPSIPVLQFTPEFAVWYRAIMVKDWTSVHMKIINRDTKAVIVEDTHSNTDDPIAYMQYYAGYVGNNDASKGFEVMVDNAEIDLLCHVVAPPPAGDPFTVDTLVTRGRLVRSNGDSSSDEFINFYADEHISHDIDFYNSYLGPNTTTHLYIVDMDGVDFTDSSWVPETPDGFELVDVKPWIKAYVVGDTRVSASGTTGYHPEPEKNPFLRMDSTWGIAFNFDNAYPGVLTLGGSDDVSIFTGGNSEGADALTMESVNSNLTHLIVNLVGYRFYFEPI